MSDNNLALGLEWNNIRKEIRIANATLTNRRYKCGLRVKKQLAI